MPTARELLEQADALMRRNRAAATDDIPVLTDSVAVTSAYPKAARPAAPPPRAPAARRAPDPIPTLTDSVASDLAGDADSVMQEGEPSDWLDLDAGETSITGEAPDSIAIVPHVAPPKRDDEALIETAEHEEIELTTPAEDAFDEELAEPPQADAESVQEPVEQPVPESAAPPLAAEFATEIVEPPALSIAAAAASKEPESVPEFPPAFGEEMVAAPEAKAPPAPAKEPETAIAPAPPAEPAPPFETLGQVQIEPATEMPPIPTVAPSPAPAAPIDENARWEAVAEEIRMQVLQRIDLFTDTGLREQLGRRLQPIVDRASADLVATINQHVGELLRAYVAEAIEREIESWRKNNG
jgi:hypothetical protein